VFLFLSTYSFSRLSRITLSSAKVFQVSLVTTLPNIVFLVLSVSLSPSLHLSFPLPPPLVSSVEMKNTRKSIIVRSVIFTDSAATSMKWSDASPPAEFSKSTKQARLFSHAIRTSRRLNFDGHYLYDQSHRSLCLRAALCGGRVLAVTIDQPITRRMELLRYFVI